MSRLQVVVGGQFGSEAKGACTAFLARKAAQNGLAAVIRVAGPNAGHTAYDSAGKNWALRQIGKRNLGCHGPALALAGRLAASSDKTARWIGRDAVRELSGEKILAKVGG